MSHPHQSITLTAAQNEAIATAGFNLPWEACGNLIRDKLTAGGGGFLMAEVPAGLGNSCARAEFIVRACNSHAGLVQALKDCLELMRLDGYNDLTSQTARDAIAALAAAGAA